MARYRSGCHDVHTWLLRATTWQTRCNHVETIALPQIAYVQVRKSMYARPQIADVHVMTAAGDLPGHWDLRTCTYAICGRACTHAHLHGICGLAHTRFAEVQLFTPGCNVVTTCSPRGNNCTSRKSQMCMRVCASPQIPDVHGVNVAQ